jgi:hypothetical protein
MFSRITKRRTNATSAAAENLDDKDQLNLSTDELVRLLCERLNLGPLPQPEAAAEETGETGETEGTESNEDAEDNKDSKDNKTTEYKKATSTSTSPHIPSTESVHEVIARPIKFLKLTCEMLQLQAETAAAQHTKKPEDLEEVKKQIFTAIVHCQSLETRLWTLWRTGS